MDSYTELRDYMDKISTRNGFKSGTFHGNYNGTVFTFRFQNGYSKIGSNEGTSKNTEEHRTFTPDGERSQYQINRNHIRAKLNPYRYQGKHFDSEIEQPRSVHLSKTSPCFDPGFSLVQKNLTLSESHLSDDGSVHPSTGSYQASHINTEDLSSQPKPPESKVQHHQSDHAEICDSPPEMFEQCSPVTPNIEEFIAEDLVIEYPVIENQVFISQPLISTPTEVRSQTPMITEQPQVTKLDIYKLLLATKNEVLDKIELDYCLPRDAMSNASEPDLLCEVCNALPPAGTKLNICIKCDGILCGACELLPSHCQHMMAGSKKQSNRRRSKLSSTLDHNLLKQGKALWEKKRNKLSDSKNKPPDIQIMPRSHEDRGFIPPSFSPPRITGPVIKRVYTGPQL